VLLVIAGRRLRAPQQDGSVFADPPLEEMRRRLAGPPWRADAVLCGRSLQELRRAGRQAALDEVRAYLDAAGQGLPISAERILAAGHQPEIFHPGVWVKNFALHGLATSAGLAPLNLVVDNDTVKATSLALPVRRDGPESYRIERVALDAWPGEVPYEECRVRDEDVFSSLPTRVAELTGDWGFTPLMGDYWAEAMRHAGRTRLLGERLVAGRRALERRWGCRNLEVPVSRLCETEPFAWFIAHLFSDVNRFHALYNAVVHEYRRVHGLRSRNHPVPDLAADGEWREVPLWAWRTGSHRRSRLFVRPAEGRFELRVEKEAWPALPAAAPALVRAWQSLHQDGFKLRSRALTTTLYTRLCVAEAFIHGIGGGKYDELTDELVRRLYSVEPPPFLVLSATLLLPLPGFAATVDQRRRLARELRDLHWNPQRHLEAPVPPETAALVEQRRALLADGPPDRERHLDLRRITERLRPLLKTAGQNRQGALRHLDAELHANAVLRRRDYAFCLYPETQLRPFCERFLH
jgi:hypothetical protein